MPPRPPAGPALEVTSVTVLPADEEPADNLDGDPRHRRGNTIADWLPGIRDEHDDEAGLAGPLAGPPDLGPDGHPEHPSERDAASDPAARR